MARTRSSRRARSLAWGAILGIAAAGGARAQDDAAPGEIVWSAESWTRSGDTYTIPGLTIEGGDLVIEAGRAVTTTLELEGRWELTASVRMSVGTARLTAESAVFEFEAGELVRGELSGDPAVFEETEPEGPGPVRAEAGRLVYDAEAGTVQMLGSVSFTEGQNDMSGCDFLYELDDGVLVHPSECGVPVEIRYRLPDDETPSNDGSPDETGAGQSGPQGETPTPP